MIKIKKGVKVIKITVQLNQRNSKKLNVITVMQGQYRLLGKEKPITKAITES